MTLLISLICGGLVLVLIYVYVDMIMVPQRDKPFFPQPDRRLWPHAEYYSDRKLRHFTMRGMFYEGLSAGDAGDFTGYAICENHEYDNYAVAIYREDGRRLGYVPKGSRKLNASLKKWLGGMSKCSGILKHWNASDKWEGKVKIEFASVEDIH